MGIYDGFILGSRILFIAKFCLLVNGVADSNSSIKASAALCKPCKSAGSGFF